MAYSSSLTDKEWEIIEPIAATEKENKATIVDKEAASFWMKNSSKKCLANTRRNILSTQEWL